MGDDTLPRAWSRYTKSHAPTLENYEVIDHQQARKDSILAAKQEHVKQLNPDGEVQEFLEVMKPRLQRQTWQNDDINAGPEASKVSKTAVASKKTGGAGIMLEKVHVVFANDEDEDLYEDLPSKESRTENVAQEQEADAEPTKEEHREEAPSKMHAARSAELEKVDSWRSRVLAHQE